jgi:hypothetical protein
MSTVPVRHVSFEQRGIGELLVKGYAMRLLDVYNVIAGEKSL